MSEAQDSIKSAVKVTKKGVQISWWLLVLAVVVFGAVFYLFKTIDTSKTENSAINKPDTADEIRIKQFMSSLRGDIARYYDQKKTYVGWAPNQTAIDQVKKMGSELKTQALTKDTYIIFAKMPNSKTVFCMDNKGNTSEITSLLPWAKSCK